MAQKGLHKSSSSKTLLIFFSFVTYLLSDCWSTQLFRGGYFYLERVE
jgi:hypothetical protein